jgi:predicted small lipoprotein YifL
MKTLLHSILVLSLVLGLSACGNKGKLKSPAQIELGEAKKARKKARTQSEPQDDTTQQDEPVPQETLPVPSEK